MRSEKISILNEVIERVKESEYCFILNYGGLKVEQLSALRKELVKLDTRMMIVKNSYLAKTAEELEWDDISDILAGQTSIVTGTGDVAEVSKLLVKFVKEHDTAAVKGANLEEKLLSAEDVTALSKLPSKDVMRSILLNTLLAPATSLVRVMNAPMLNMLYALKAYEEKNESAA